MHNVSYVYIISFLRDNLVKFSIFCFRWILTLGHIVRLTMLPECGISTQTRSDQKFGKRVNAGLPKLFPGFLNIFPGFPK